MTLKWLALLPCVLVVFLSAFAKQSSTAPTKDPQAVAVIQSAISAMGGAAVIGSVQNSVVIGSSVNSAESQNGTQTFIWTYAGNQFRNENDAQTGSHILVSNSGTPQDYQDGSWVPSPAAIIRANLPYHIPALVLLNEINDAAYSIAYIGTTPMNGVDAIHIQTLDDSDAIGQVYTLQDWYFDPTSGIPLRVEFQIPVDQKPQDSVQAAINFSNFQAVSGILVPLQLNITEGPSSCTSTVTSVVFNANISPSEFTSGTGVTQ